MDHGDKFKLQFREACKQQPTVFEKRLQNWVRWCTARGAGGGQCGSIEGRYRPPAQGLFNPQSVPIPVDIKDAILMNNAFLKLPPKYQALVKAWHVNEEHPGAIARAVGCQFIHVKGLVRMAEKMLQNILRFMERHD